MAVQPFGPRPLFQFFILYTVGRTPCTGDQPVARPLPTHRATQTQTSMPVFEREKKVHALDHAATVLGETKSTPPVLVTGSSFNNNFEYEI
jgi:hypothetical protein